jgi:O-antigen/teichoic acid export membrane protein
MPKSGVTYRRGRPTAREGSGITKSAMVPHSTYGLVRSRGRHRRRGPSRIAQIREFIAESMLRNSAFLILNLVFSAGCGYVALTLLTRIYSVQAVGLSAAAASASALVIAITQFGANYSLPRFLPTTAHRTALINTSLTLILLGTMFAAVIYLTLPLANKLYALGGWLFAIVFVVAACLQAGESAVEVILVADRSSSKLVRANAVPNVVKVIAPAALSFLGVFGAYAARVVSDVFGFILLSIALARGSHRFRPTLSITATRELGRFSVGMYIAGLVGGLPFMVLPLIVLSRFGAKQSAYWAIAIAISTLLYQLPGAVSQALLPEVSYRPSERRYLMLRSAALTIGLMLPTLIIAYIAAPFVLALFGHSYVAGSLVPLRWLIIAGFITMLNYVTGSILLLAKKSFLITVVNFFDAVIVLGMASIWAKGVDDTAVAWAVGDVANTVLFGLFAILALYEVRGRWESLGGKEVQAPPSALEISTVDSQQSGLTALYKLAEFQRIESRVSQLCWRDRPI